MEVGGAGEIGGDKGDRRGERKTGGDEGDRKGEREIGWEGER